MIRVERSGIQTTIQASPRTGRRHLGIPWSGAADPLSMALANRLCGNSWDAAALEITFGAVELRIENEVCFSVTGAVAALELDGRPIQPHQCYRAENGARLSIGVGAVGLRIYLAVSGGFLAESFFDSMSTYLPAHLGGFDGRRLADGDVLEVGEPGEPAVGSSTPQELIPRFADTHVLRVCPSAEFASLTHDSRKQLFQRPFWAARQLDRMGIRLERNRLVLRQGGEQIPSAAVHPGVIQCPEGGTPILLGVDAQTTGGYPRILSVIGADLHRIGQIRPGDRIQLFYCSAAAAAEDARGLLAYYESWIGSDWLYSH